MHAGGPRVASVDLPRCRDRAQSWRLRALQAKYTLRHGTKEGMRSATVSKFGILALAGAAGCTLLPLGQSRSASQPQAAAQSQAAQPADPPPTTVANADGTTTVKAPPKRSGSQRALHPEIDDAVRGYAVEQTLTGDIKSFTPIAFDAPANHGTIG